MTAVAWAPSCILLANIGIGGVPSQPHAGSSSNGLLHFNYVQIWGSAGIMMHTACGIERGLL